MRFGAGAGTFGGARHDPRDRQSAAGPVTSPDEPLVASMTPTSATHMASAAPNAPSEGFFSSLARKVGLSGATADATASAQPLPVSVAAKPKVEAKRNEQPSKTATAPKSDTKQAASARC